MNAARDKCDEKGNTMDVFVGWYIHLPTMKTMIGAMPARTLRLATGRVHRETATLCKNEV